MTDLAVLVRQLQGHSKVAFPYSAGWSNIGAGFEGASYSRHGRVVRLQGMVTKAAGTPADGDVIGTLPANHRPEEILRFTVVTGTGRFFGAIDVEPDGQVVWRAGATGETDYVSFSGVSFVVEV
jgi:hypothetical protein